MNPKQEKIIKQLKKENAALKAGLAKVKLQAETDGLTGLKNRFTIIPDLRRILREGTLDQRPQKNIGVLMLDIDWFKTINDTYGHLVGDAVLRKAAHIVQAGVKVSARRAHDEIYRYGGEEFLVVLPFTGSRGVAVVGERVRQNIARQLISYFPQIKKERQKITVSIGGSTVPIKKLSRLKGRSKLLDKTIEEADRSLYRAKEGGRNRTVINRKVVKLKLKA